MKANFIVLLLGILYSCLLHLSRGMQRLGIHSFDRFRDHIKGRNKGERSAGNHYIYLLGLTVSNLSVILVMIAGKIGTISYFTAMYGIGMFPMLIFSHYVMKERITRLHWLGTCFIILGGFVLSLAAHNTHPVEMEKANLTNLFITLILITVITPFIIRWGKKSGHLFKDALAAGLIAGLIASLDPVLKATAQNLDIPGRLIPSNPLGWFIFILSIAASTAALLITQHAYSRRVFVSQFLPYYNVAYITTPMVVQILILPKYSPAASEMIGLLIIITGIIIFSQRELRITKNTEILKEEEV